MAESTEAPPDPGLSINTNGPPPETTVYIFYAPFLEFGFTPTVVLQQFTIHTMAQFYGALGAVAGTAFLYQLLAAFKERLYNRYLRVQRLRISNEIDTGDDEESCDGCSCMLFMFLTGLHIVQIFCGFIILLVAASFNGWLIGSMIAGSALGYLMGMWRCCCDHVHTEFKIP